MGPVIGEGLIREMAYCPTSHWGWMHMPDPSSIQLLSPTKRLHVAACQGCGRMIIANENVAAMPQSEQFHQPAAMGLFWFVQPMLYIIREELDLEDVL
jgi:hypothetical protein